MYKRTRLIAIAATLSLLVPVQQASANSADDQYTVAAAHYTHGRWELAAEEFQAFLKQYPDERRRDMVEFFLAESLVQLRRFAQAQRLFTDFVERVPQHAHAKQARFRIGEMAFLAGDHDAAKQALQEFREQHPQDPLIVYALAYLGELALAAQDGAAAEAAYREVIENHRQSPVDRQCRFGLAQALELQQNWDEASRFYRFLAENDGGELADDAQLRMGALAYKQSRYEATVQELQDFAETYPQSGRRVEAGYWLGLAQTALDRYEDAAATLLVASADASGHGLAPAIEFSLGEALRKGGNDEAAELRYHLVLSGWPQSPYVDDALEILTLTAFDRGDFDRVEELGRQFAEHHADSGLAARVQQTVGRGLLKQQRYEEAASIFQELGARPEADRPSTQSKPNRFERTNRYYLGLAYLGTHRDADALASLDRVNATESDGELWAGVQVARAAALVALDRFQEAIPPLRAYLQAYPEGADATQCTARLAVSLAETGEFAAAARAWNELEEKHGDHDLFLPTTQYVAERAHAEGEVDLAARLFERMTSQGNPQEYVARGLAGLGKTQLKGGDSAASAETFAELLEMAPESSQAAEAALLRARSLESQKQYDAALSAYLHVLEDFRESAQVPWAMFSAAKLHDTLEQDHEAVALLEQLVTDHPQFPQMDAVLYRLAWVQMDLGRQTESDRTFRQLARDFENSKFWGDAVYRQAERAVQADDLDAAGKLLKRLISQATDPGILSHAVYLQGKVAVETEHWTDVLTSMQRVSTEFPESPLQLPAQYWTAEARYRLEQYEEAGEAFDQLAESTKDRQDAWLAMVPLRRAQVLAQQQEWAAAQKIAEDIGEQFPEFRQQYEVDYLLGRCLSNQAKFSEAREAYLKVVRSPTGGRTETAAMAQWMIGEAYFHQKEYDTAIRAYHRVESLYAFPRWQAAALLQAGKCHELKSEWKQALRLYAQLLKEYPQTPFAEDASRRLKQLRVTNHNSPDASDAL